MRRSCGRCSHDEDEFGVHLHRMWSDSVHGTPCGTLMPPTGYGFTAPPATRTQSQSQLESQDQYAIKSVTQSSRMR